MGSDWTPHMVTRSRCLLGHELDLVSLDHLYVLVQLYYIHVNLWKSLPSYVYFFIQWVGVVQAGKMNNLWF